MDKRTFPRIAATFPVELKDKGYSRHISSSVKGKIIDISEGGLKAVTSEFLRLPVGIYINLPPCYSKDAAKAEGIDAQVKLIWSRPMTTKGKFLYGFRFLRIAEKNTEILSNMIKYEIEKSSQETLFTTKPTIDIHREPHSCNMYAIDLTMGCEYGCRYCHFSKFHQNEWQKKYPLSKNFPIPVDISPIYKMKKFPETVVYLSPSSDAFTTKARELTHELLSFMLPKGVIFTISTKSIIPDKTIKLLKKYHHLIEGIAITVTNLSDERNNLLEPGCPTARERLEHIRKLKEIGCFIGARMDPMFPLIDDSDENLNHMIKEIAEAGAGHITGSYLFTFGKCLKELKQIPQLKESLKLIKEKIYPLGGVAFSVPLEYKRKIYDKMNEMCKSYNIKFNTCGCKDVTLTDTNYSLICRNIDYY